MAESLEAYQELRNLLIKFVKNKNTYTLGVGIKN